MEHVRAAEKEYRHGASGPKYLLRGPRLEWGVLRLLPGETLGGHYHTQVEETFFFTAGTCVMRVDGEAHRAGPGDAFRIEPGEAHDIENDGTEPVDMVFIKCPYLPDDKASVST